MVLSLKFRKFFSSVLIAFLLFAICTATTAFAANKILRVGTEPTFAPFEFKQDGKIVGFDVDLTRAIARKAGFDVLFVDLGFDALIPALQSNTIDLVAAAMTITPERSRSVDFTDPYYTSGLSVMVNAKDKSINSIDDLQGKIIAVQIGNEGARVAQKIPRANVVSFNTMDEAILELLNFGADAVLADTPVLDYYIVHRDNGRVKLVGENLQSQPYGIAVRKGNTELLDKLSGALFELKSNGEYDKIYAKWFVDKAPIAETQTAPRDIFHFVLSILPLLLAGAKLTVKISVLSVFFGLILGLIFGVMRVSPFKLPRIVSAVYVGFLRGTPLLVQIFIAYFALPQLLGHRINPFFAAILACSLNSGAYVAEIFRAGIKSVDKGQFEACASLGLSRFKTMRFVIIPQAWRNVLPALCNEFIAMLKDSSLVSVIGFEELTRQGQLVIAQTYASVEVWCTVAVIYLIMTLAVSCFVSFLEKRGAADERDN